MTDLTRVQLEALLDGSINDHLDYDHDTGEVTSCIRASSPSQCSHAMDLYWQPLSTSPANSCHDDRTRRSAGRTGTGGERASGCFRTG